MRRRSAIVVGLIGCVGVALLLGVGRHRSPAPQIGLTVLGYTNRGSFLDVAMQLTNKGPGSVSYSIWRDIPYGWVKAETSAGWTNSGMAPPFTGGLNVVRPGSTEAFSFPLPGGTLRWKCGFSVSAASFRERVGFNMWRIGLLGRSPKIIEAICDWVVEHLPDTREPELDFQSELFEVGGSAHNPAGGADGRQPFSTVEVRSLVAAASRRSPLR